GEGGGVRGDAGAVVVVEVVGDAAGFAVRIRQLPDLGVNSPDVTFGGEKDRRTVGEPGDLERVGPVTGAEAGFGASVQGNGLDLIFGVDPVGGFGDGD